ncbi:hypothetical protein EV426DRAFT_702417 [Tirmania nivea]|nr:hypothetical protein EV426DRAFT_702417 [Tirmania nivea]
MSTQVEGQPAHRGRRAQNQKSQGTGEEVMESGSIKWDRDHGKLLAYKLKDKYKTKYLCGTRIATKAVAGVMLKKYKEVRDHFLKTGAGDIIETAEVDGVPIQVKVTRPPGILWALAWSE